MSFRLRTTVVYFRRRTLVVGGELQMENYFKWRTVVGFAQRTKVVCLDKESQWLAYNSGGP